MVIQNSLDVVSPFRIKGYTINKTFCRTAVTDQKHMLLVIAIGTQGA